MIWKCLWAELKLKTKYIINLIVYDNWTYKELNEIWEIINQIKGENENEKKITNSFEENFSNRYWSLKELGIISRKVLQNEARPLYLIKF